MEWGEKWLALSFQSAWAGIFGGSGSPSVVGEVVGGTGSDVTVEVGGSGSEVAAAGGCGSDVIGAGGCGSVFLAVGAAVGTAAGGWPSGWGWAGVTGLAAGSRCCATGALVSMKLAPMDLLRNGLSRTSCSCIVTAECCEEIVSATQLCGQVLIDPQL